MEYGQIFHVMRIGKYYCKNMKYRINTKYSTLPSGISPASGNIPTLGTIYADISQRRVFNI